VAEEHAELLLRMEKETENWTVLVDDQGIVLSSKEIEGSPLKAFKYRGEVAGTSAAKLVEMIWNWDFTAWKAFQSDLEAVKTHVINDKLRLLYQVSGLPWPLWNRDACMLNARIEKEGSIVLTMNSVPHDAFPEYPSQFVRASLSIGGFVFTDKGDDVVQVARLVHVNPNGNIPSSIVNSRATGLHRDILKLRVLAEGQKTTQ